MQWTKEERARLKQRIADIGDSGDLESLDQKRIALEQEMTESDFWSDSVRAQEKSLEAQRLKNLVLPWKDLLTRFSDVEEMYEEARSDAQLLDTFHAELDQIADQVQALELKQMLSGEMDDRSCFITINAGAGGTESCDWVEMLERLYCRFCGNRGWKVERIDRVEGDVAGSKSLTLQVQGEYAYGYCKSEHGVHRLVRISPFDAQGRRHTSFASVEILPLIEEAQSDAIRSDDLRIETYRASGAGGQHVNKTDSAVRITHIPTGIVVSCQNERSQLQNKETCMKMLQAHLFEKAKRERQEKVNALKGDQKEIAWGSQIRSYVMQPYTLVKDLRTQIEVGDVHAVMDGEIDVFVEGYLRKYGG